MNSQRIRSVLVLIAVVFTSSLITESQTPYQKQDPVVGVIFSKQFPNQPAHSDIVNKSARPAILEPKQATREADADLMMGKLLNYANESNIEGDMNAFWGKDACSIKNRGKNDSDLILHLAVWGQSQIQSTPPNKDYALKLSAWAGFHRYVKSDGECGLKEYLRSDNSPQLRGKTNITLLALDYFESGGNPPPIAYKYYTIAQVPQNIQNLGTAITALTGAVTSVAGGSPEKEGVAGDQANPPPTPALWVAVGRIDITAPLPYSLGISEVLTPGSAPKSKPTAGAGADALALPDGKVGVPYDFVLSSFLSPHFDDAKLENPDDITGGCPKPDFTTGVLHLVIPKPGPSAAQLPRQCSYALTSAGSNAVLRITPYFTVDTTASTLEAAPAGDASTLAASPAQGKGGASGGQNQQGKSSGNASPTPAQPVDCTDITSAKPCTFTRNFTVDDIEYWDISLGVSIPGPTEEVYPNPIVYTAPTPTPGAPKKAVHTDAYAFVDFYLLAHWFPKDSFFIPHLNAGIPIKSQPLHRPYLGLGLPLTKPFQRTGLPVEIDAFGGVISMKQTIYDAHTSTYKLDRAWKPVWGIEIPISAIASKLASAAKGGGSSKGSSSN